MNSCKVVTVCSSDSGYLNNWNNSFNPDRRSLSRGERKPTSKEKSRIQSAPLSSILRPVSYSEFRNNLPLLITHKLRAMDSRKCSVDSDTLRKEINSAVLLLQSRNEFDMQPQSINTPNVLETRLEKCHYKVHDRNQLSQSAQKMIEQRAHKDIPRWKSARISREQESNNSTRKYHLRVMSVNELQSKISEESLPSSTVKKLKQTVNHRVIQPNLVVSSSNFLANFVTIDDISGAKKYWIDMKEKFLSTDDIYDRESRIHSTIEVGATKHFEENDQFPKRRDDVLRQYMDVYMHWRTINSIEEHQSLVNRKHRDCKSAKVRNATPKERHEQFKKSISEIQSQVPKINDASTTTVRVDSFQSDLLEESINESSELSIEIKPNKIIKETITNVLINVAKEEELIKSHKIEDDLNSDVYSEIDWLECEDI